MRIKWIYWTITVLLLFTATILTDHFPYVALEYTWILIIFSGIGTAICWFGFVAKNSKLYKHFHKKINIQIKIKIS